MPDYTTQLDQIVRALSRPGTSVWLVAAFSASLGVLGGIAGQSVSMLLTNAYRSHRLRKLLYRDLAHLFEQVHWIMTMEPEKIPWQDKGAWQRDQLRRGLLFRGEKECVDNQSLYVHLPERIDGETLYSRFHRIIDELDIGSAAVNVNTTLALNIFVDIVRQGSLRRKYLKRFLSPKSAARLLKILDEYDSNSIFV